MNLTHGSLRPHRSQLPYTPPSDESPNAGTFNMNLPYLGGPSPVDRFNISTTPLPGNTVTFGQGPTTQWPPSILTHPPIDPMDTSQLAQTIREQRRDYERLVKQMESPQWMFFDGDRFTPVNGRFFLQLFKEFSQQKKPVGMLATSFPKLRADEFERFLYTILQANTDKTLLFQQPVDGEFSADDTVVWWHKKPYTGRCDWFNYTTRNELYAVLQLFILMSFIEQSMVEIPSQGWEATEPLKLYPWQKRSVGLFPSFQLTPLGNTWLQLKPVFEYGSFRPQDGGVTVTQGSLSALQPE